MMRLYYHIDRVISPLAQLDFILLFISPRRVSGA